MVAGWLLEGIGQITSAVSGRQKFSSEFLILFQQDNGRMVPCGKDSGYQSGSASANDTDSFFVHGSMPPVLAILRFSYQ